jgi:hypothetical protein
LFDKFPIQIYLKQGDILSQLLFSLVLKYAIGKVQGNEIGLKLNRIYQLMIYPGDENILGDNICTIEKNVETLSKRRENYVHIDISSSECSENS